jgi:hypothetical protein
MCLGLSEKALLAISAYIKCQTLNGVSVNCSPETLLASAVADGFFEPGISMKQLLAINAYLDCQINNTGGGGGGGGTGVQCGNYAGGEPTFTPATCGVAVDTSNGRVWWYYNGAWN